MLPQAMTVNCRQMGRKDEKSSLVLSGDLMTQIIMANDRHAAIFVCNHNLCFRDFDDVNFSKSRSFRPLLMVVWPVGSTSSTGQASY